MSNILTMAMGGVPYGPVNVISSNANAALPSTIVTNNARNAVRVLITCEDNPIRYGFGGIIPVDSLSGHVLAENDSLVLGHPEAISSFRYISAIAGAHANLQITGEYSE